MKMCLGQRCLVYKVFGVKGACCKLCLVKNVVWCKRCRVSKVSDEDVPDIKTGLFRNTCSW